MTMVVEVASLTNSRAGNLNTLYTLQMVCTLTCTIFVSTLKILTTKFKPYLLLHHVWIGNNGNVSLSNTPRCNTYVTVICPIHRTPH